MNNAQHFFWRAGFGPTASMLFQQGKFKASYYFETYWKLSQSKVEPITVVKNVVDGLANGINNAAKANKDETPQKERREKIQQQNRDNLRGLNLLWLDEMVDSEAQLREKIALFWHGHFACRNLNSFFQQQLLHVIREGALGSFADLLEAVSKSPAMLAFLNNQQNRKQQPNENFAREVMELFTLGRGHYTEQDIKEAARAFTGWGFNADGEFVFRKNQHDFGSKTIFGKTGNFSGDDVLTMLIENKQTASYITSKLYRFLVNEEPNPEHVQWLATRFYNSGYQMKQLLQDIFTADWFYADNNQGTQVKSPVLLWVGMRRMLPMQLENPEIQMLLQRALGQILLYPPSVAGWPGGTNWIDSSSLLLRMRLPQLVALAEPFNINTKADDDMQMGRMQDAMGKQGLNRFKLKGDIVWEPLIETMKPHQKEITKVLPDYLLQTRHALHNSIAAQIAPGLAFADQVKQITMLSMATPAYQLC